MSTVTKIHSHKIEHGATTQERHMDFETEPVTNNTHQCNIVDPIPLICVSRVVSNSIFQLHNVSSREQFKTPSLSQLDVDLSVLQQSQKQVGGFIIWHPGGKINVHIARFRFQINHQIVNDRSTRQLLQGT